MQGQHNWILKRRAVCWGTSMKAYTGPASLAAFLKGRHTRKQRAFFLHMHLQSTSLCLGRLKGSLGIIKATVLLTESLEAAQHREPDIPGYFHPSSCGQASSHGLPYIKFCTFTSSLYNTFDAVSVDSCNFF